MKSLLKRLKRLCENEGTHSIAIELGYRSGETVYKWFRKKEIPKGKIRMVKEFVEWKEAQ